jgi:protein KRI1
MNLKMKPAAKKELFDDENSADDSSSSADDAGKNVDGSSSSSSSSSESEAKLTVNKKFAKEYQNRKQREELRQISQQRREEGLGSDVEDDSSDDDEDEEGNLLTDSVNLQFLKTIKALKKKDSAIYDPNSRFFDENDPDEGSDEDESTEIKRKPRKFKDVIRDQILEDIEAEENGKAKASKVSDSVNSKLAYDDEQEKLRKAFLKDSNGDDDEEEDWMTVKQKGATPKDGPKTAEIEEGFKVLEHLSGKKKDSDTFADPRGEVEDGEQYLIDFMKNKKWIDKDAVGDNDVDEDDEDLDRADDFEAKYNFRFEQAEAETAASGASLSIQTYARGQTMNTMRRQDPTRKDKRSARKERKEAERKAKEEQLKRLKNAKQQEVQQKLSQVKSVLGSMEEGARR